MEAAALESVEDLTPEWMTAVLAQNGIAATVCRVFAAPVGNGQMGSCYRLVIGYDAGDGPDRLIVKLPATDSASRAAGQLGYRCETTFYREVANRLHLDIPRCYFAASAGRTTDTGYFKARSSLCWARSSLSPPHGATGCSPSWPKGRRRRSPT
jgi:hypothetical protein